MSTVQEIQNAIAGLPEMERLSPFEWIHTQEEAGDQVDDSSLLAEAEEGARQLDAGQGVPLDEVRKLTSKWTTK